MSRFALLVVLLLASGLAGALPQHAAPSAAVVTTLRDNVAATVEPAMANAQHSTAAVVTPAVVAAREALQSLVPPPAQSGPPPVSPAAVTLIVRWEVSGRSYYDRRLRSPMWPGGASGVTWGIGYDGGHQTALQIGRDWSTHDAVARLQSTAGIIGTPARSKAAALRDVQVPWSMANDVFATATLPRYRAAARRAFGADAFDALPADASGALVSLVYNRGSSMLGDSRSEMRTIRDDCVPGGDVHCIAVELRHMCRIWIHTALYDGLCNRRKDEALLAEAAR